VNQHAEYTTRRTATRSMWIIFTGISITDSSAVADLKTELGKILNEKVFIEDYRK
jgi:hypothetical protein